MSKNNKSTNNQNIIFFPLFLFQGSNSHSHAPCLFTRHFLFQKIPQVDQVHTVVCQGCLGVGPAVGETRANQPSNRWSRDRIPGPHEKRKKTPSYILQGYQISSPQVCFWWLRGSKFRPLEDSDHYFPLNFWSNYSDLTRPISSKWWFSMGNPLFQGNLGW